MPRAKQKTAFLGEQTVRILLGVPLSQAGWLIHALCDWIENDREPTRDETPDDCVGSWIAIHDESVRIHESRKQQADAGRAGADKTNGERAANERRTRGERAANARQEIEGDEDEDKEPILRTESEVAGKPASASASASVFTDLDSLDWFTLPERALVDRALALIGEEGNARMAGRLRKARRILGLPAFREVLATFDSELRAGEVPANKGATLNARLSAREALG
jgi:hypothetical protein